MVFHMDVYAVSWDHSVYAGIRQFHQARGFDPYSQEVAAALGYPLLHVHWEEDARFADMQENDSGDHYSDTDGVSDSQDVSESGDEKSESDNSVSADSLLVQEADISASHRSSSTQEIISDHEETLRLPDGLDEIDEQYVVNTSIIWGGYVGNPSSWNDNPWE
ncbi:hypothetical protein B0H13DRAFT_128893 [Mycena leptocephala]|nr:hypothetical protein B0H13DRAFT_128893 [Mycena leptocephala]